MRLGAVTWPGAGPAAARAPPSRFRHRRAPQATTGQKTFEETLKLAALLPRGPDTDPDDWPTSAAVFQMATAAGQRVLREPAEHALAGRIVPGAPADLAVFDDDPDGMDEDTVAVRLVLGGTGRRARHVVAGGRILLENGRSTTIDVDAIRAALGDTRMLAGQETCA